MSMADGFLSNMLISCCHLWPRVIHLRFSPNDQLTIGWEEQKGEQDILLTNVYNHGNHGHPVPKNFKSTLVKIGKHLCPDVPGLAFHFLSRSSRNRMVVPYSSPSQSLRLGTPRALNPSRHSQSKQHWGHQVEAILDTRVRPTKIISPLESSHFISNWLLLVCGPMAASVLNRGQQGPHDFSVVANPPNIFESTREKITTSNQIWEINHSPNSTLW